MHLDLVPNCHLKSPYRSACRSTDRSAFRSEVIMLTCTILFPIGMHCV